MLAKCDEIGYIKKFFGEMLEKNVVYWNEIIIWDAQLGDDEKALRIFKQVYFENFDFHVSHFQCEPNDGGKHFQDDSQNNRKSIIFFFSIENLLRQKMFYIETNGDIGHSIILSLLF